MAELWHYLCIGISIGIGFSIVIVLLMWTDKFLSDLDWKFWEWQRKNFKNKWTGK